MTRYALPLALCLLAAGSFAQSGLKVNEYSLGSPDWLEIINFGASPVNLGGYRVYLGQNSGTQFLLTTYTFPAGVTINPGARIVLTDQLGATAPIVPAGTQIFYIGSNVQWFEPPSTSTGGSIALTDAINVGIDRVKWNTPNTELSFGTPFTGTVSMSTTGVNVGYRNSNNDTNAAADWSTSSTSTPGSLNPGQTPSTSLTLDFTSSAPGQLTVTVVTLGPPVPNAEFYNLVSLIDSVPDGSGPLFGVGGDALFLAISPKAPGNPFHDCLDASGQWSLSVPAGTLPSGLHIEAASVLIEGGAITRISTVDTITIP